MLKTICGDCFMIKVSFDVLYVFIDGFSKYEKKLNFYLINKSLSQYCNKFILSDGKNCAYICNFSRGFYIRILS